MMLPHLFLRRQQLPIHKRNIMHTFHPPHRLNSSSSSHNTVFAYYNKNSFRTGFKDEPQCKINYPLVPLSCVCFLANKRKKDIISATTTQHTEINNTNSDIIIIILPPIFRAFSLSHLFMVTATYIPVMYLRVHLTK